ncbi:hypothetical protein D5278_07345 [bacterium 1XD21-13]|nr:hypothetical protein [bacterium 1XD21-13]
MRLDYLYLDGYKGLKNFEVDFKKQPSGAAIHFFIGRNGSGKSTLLEAIGLIFTRMLQGELPGFGFELRYQMADGAQIRVKPAAKDASGGKLEIEVIQDGNTRRLDRISEQYLPDRIISYCSGSNHSMEEILLSSPKASLASDLYDLSLAEEDGQAEQELEEILHYYEQLERNPRALFLDGITSGFVLPVLFSILPVSFPVEREEQEEHERRKEREEQEARLREYNRRREKLAGRLSIKLDPVAFSIQVDEEKLEAAGDIPQINILRRIFGMGTDRSELLGDFTVRRQMSGQTDAEGNPLMETTVTFLYRNYGNEEKPVYYNPGLQRFFGGNPFVFLSALLTAYRKGVIRAVTFAFRDGDKKGLYETEALSDGELMWLSRMGLVLMAQPFCGVDTLFLFDEPDVHFNDDWNRDFVKVIYELSEGTGHGFVVATHSTLILTDAEYEQITLLEHESETGMEVKEADISTFAAQRDEISKQIFDADAIGAYAEEAVRQMMEETNPEKMRGNLRRLGPGYERFRLWEQFYSLEDTRREG